MDIDSLAQAIFGRPRAETQEVSTNSTTRTYTGVATSDSVDGTVMIDLGGDVTLPDDLYDEDGNVVAEYASEGIEVSTGPSVQEGDEVTVTLVGGSALKTPMVTSVSGEGDRQNAAIALAKTVADAAQAVADAVNQHFFSDTNGIHVTEATQEDWDESHTGANVLINALGQLFRDGLNNLLTLTTQDDARALTIWDGLGNEADNILAQFSGNRIRLGKHIDDNEENDGAYVDFFDGDWFVNRLGSNVFVRDDPNDPARTLSLGMSTAIEGTFPGTKAFIDASFGASAQVYGDELGAHEQITRSSLSSGTSGRYSSTSMGVVTTETYGVVDGHREKTGGSRQAYIHADELELTYDVGQFATTRTHSIEHVSVVLRSPVGTYTGTNTTATASASGWQLTYFNTVVAEVGSPRTYDYSFSNGVLTARRDCVLEISGVMNWTDTLQGNRGFGVFEGNTAGSGTEHSAFQNFSSSVSNRKSVVFPPKLFTLTAGSSLTFGRYQQQNAVYVNGYNYSWVAIRVVD